MGKKIVGQTKIWYLTFTSKADGAVTGGFGASFHCSHWLVGPRRLWLTSIVASVNHTAAIYENAPLSTAGHCITA